MNQLANHSPWRSALQGVREAIPLLGGYLPVALSFGLVASQAGFSTLEATAISALIYAGASQFLFVGMIATGLSITLLVWWRLRSLGWPVAAGVAAFGLVELVATL
jgi:predicted branched-subunit amino acid permease